MGVDGARWWFFVKRLTLAQSTLASMCKLSSRIVLSAWQAGAVAPRRALTQIPAARR
jgi:hypothetical protein